MTLDVQAPASATARALAPPEVSVVVPTFNERANVRSLIDRVAAALPARSFEIVFVDDDSPDGTAAAVREAGRADVRVRCLKRVGRRGLAGATIEGMLAAQAPVVAVIDGDLQHDERLLEPMLEAIEDNRADIVIGSRYVKGGDAGGLSATRLWGSRLSGAFARALTGVELADPMSGFFMLRQETVETLAPGLSTQGFKILLDILASARGKLRPLELPYVFRAREAGESKLDARTVIDFLGLVLAKASGNLISPRFVSFLSVGLSGLAVHLSVVALLLGLGFGTANAVATLIAMTSNFYLNNRITYRDQRVSGLRALRSLLYFYLICSVGAVSGNATALWLHGLGLAWYLASASGAVIAAFWNYALSALFVWREAAK